MFNKHLFRKKEIHLKNRWKLCVSLLMIAVFLFTAICPIAAASDSYADYLTKIEGNAGGEEATIDISLKDAIGDKTILNDYEGKSGISVQCEAEKDVTFSFAVSAAGNYNIAFMYYTGAGSGAAISRDIYIDGELPFKEAAEISLPQLWEDNNNGKHDYDLFGNQIRLKQVRKKAWVTEFAYDSSGRNSEALKFYFPQGQHTLTLRGGSEPLVLGELKLEPCFQPSPYKETLEKSRTDGIKNANDSIMFEAEENCLKSDNTMYAIPDTTSPTVSPYSASKVTYNAIGGTQWKLSGQWLQWEIDVPETALYQIGCHFKQSDKVGDVSVRELYIDGKLPFVEAADIQFNYSSLWQFQYFSNGETPYLFSLSKGKHTIRMKVGLGSTAESIIEANECLTELNSIYRRIVVITGTSPDQYRDYQLDKTIPQVFDDMSVLYKKITALKEEILGDAKSSQSTSELDRVCLLLKQMLDDSDKVAVVLSSFQDSLSSFGTWISSRTEQPLTLDKIVLMPPESENLKGEAGFFSRMFHYIRQFAYSFVTDYTSIGVTEKNPEKEIKVWIASGRDQSQILKQLINDNFTSESGIAVDLQLVTSAALLPSIIAGTAPDVYMGMGQADPINLAMRDALFDLSAFEDFEDIAQRFNSEAIVPFRFNDGIYALPDTMAFNMLFCRTDILEEIGVKKEQLSTWKSILKNVLPELQVNSLSFGIPVGINSYITFLYQNGGTVYKDNGKKSALSDSTAISCMEYFTKMYTQYGLPLSFDFANRFRSGEMPIAVADYLSYNQLTVFAPEIKGLWTMLPVPGVEQSDGTIMQANPITVTGSVILSGSKKQNESWQYLKWWSSTETQREYGSELESVVGAAARYNSANCEAVTLTNWNSDMKRSLINQMNELKAYPEVPGGYLTSRYYDFAFRDIVYNGDKIRETMINSVQSIDDEIAHKRVEYGLD